MMAADLQSFGVKKTETKKKEQLEKPKPVKPAIKITKTPGGPKSMRDNSEPRRSFMVD